MSQQNINQALPNGLPPNWCGTTPNMVPPQKTQTFSPHNVNNGLGSSQSSRDSSPATRFSSVPTSQLPPLRGNIPSSQLPPGRPGLSPIPHNLETNSSNGHISASVTQQSENTPHSSPRVTNFSTSTPNPIPNLISKSTENSSVVQQTSVNNFPSNYTPQQNTPSNIINSTNAPQNIRTNMSPQPAFNPSSMQPLKPPSKGPNLIKGQQTSLTHSSSTPTLPNLTQSGHLGRQDLNQPPAIQRPSSSGPQLQQQNPPNTQAELLSGPSQFAPAQNIMVNPLQQQPQNSPLNAPINSVNSMTQPSKPQNFPSQQNMPPVPISQPLSSDGNVPPKPQNIMGQQHMHPTLSEQNQQKNTPPSSVNSINQQQNLQFIATQQNMGQQQIPPVSQPVLLTSTQQINPPSTSVNNLVQSQNPQYFPTQQNMGPSNSQPISSIATQQINAPPNSGNNIGQPIKSQYFPQQNMGQPMPPTSEPIQPPSSINNMNQPIRPPYFTPQQNMGQQNVPLISKPVSAVTQQKNVTSSPINNMNQPPRPQYVAPQQNMSQPPLPPMQQKPPVPVDNRLQTNNMNYASQNTRPPLVSGTGIPPNSNYPTTPVSNLHSKRYPQPVNQNFPNTNQQGTTYPPTINNYNQPQQPTNTLYQQTNMYNQQQTNMYNQQQQQQQQQQYPQNYQQQQATQQRNYQQMTQQMQNMNIVKTGFNKLWGQDNYDLLQCPNVLPEEAIEPPKVRLGQEFLDAANCSPEIFRCTMTKIPENNSLLQKSRLPLGVLIHPFKDLNHLPVIQCNTIVRCRACRTYINPFIFFVDTKRWKCNLCYRVNELPEEFQYDPVSKSYGDPSRRPEIKSSTIEYIAPSEYMLRPPQPAVYLFLLDISRLAVESGYLHTVCGMLSSQLASLPGDARTQIGFIAYNSTLHFFSLAEGLNQPHEMIVSDVDDVFLPCPDNLLVNLKELMELVTDLLAQLPTRYQNTFDNGSALGAALQAAFKMMSSTGGRVTVFQASLPTLGPGALTAREDPNQRAGKEAPHLNPATDFYKRLALDCSGHQIAVDLFILNSQYVDIATLSGISRFSGGCMYHFPLFNATKTIQVESLERCFQRYLTRKIGFEAVMRIRCTRGLAIHTFHGNFFVRSTDLLSLPNVNPDAGFGMQVSIEESLSDLQSVCFQAALLYTSSKGERRIRVHTLCLPVVNTLSDVLNSADQQCIVGILSKMAVDRSLQSSLSDARDAFINVAIDILSSYKLSLNMGTSASGLLAPQSLKLLPLYILALLKYTAFRTGTSTRLDDRVFAMCDMKTLPLAQLVQHVYPDLYPIYRLAECPNIVDNEGVVIPQPRRLQLTSRNIDTHGAYLLDAGQHMYIYVCQNVSQQFLVHTLGVPNFKSIPDQCYELQTIDNPDNQRLHAFINSLNDEKPYSAALQIIRDDSSNRILMLERLVEDRIEFALSYNEFLQHLKTQVK